MRTRHIMMRWFLLPVALAVAGCATKAPPSAVDIQGEAMPHTVVPADWKGKSIGVTDIGSGTDDLTLDAVAKHDRKCRPRSRPRRTPGTNLRLDEGDAGGGGPHEHLSRPGHRVGHLDDVELIGTTEGIEPNLPHDRLP